MKLINIIIINSLFILLVFLTGIIFNYLTIIIIISINVVLLLFLNNKGKYTNVSILYYSILISLIVFELVFRNSFLDLFYFRPHNYLNIRSTELTLLRRYQEDCDLSMNTFGDLAAIHGEEEYRQYRKIDFVTDQYGFRNNRYQSSQIIDLITIGDSFTIGNGITQDSLWVSRISERLKLKTYNLGMPGGPWQAYMNLNKMLPKLKLSDESKVILALFTGNDLQDPYHTFDISKLPWRSQWERLGTWYANFTSKSPLRILVNRVRLNTKREENPVSVYQLNNEEVLFLKDYIQRSEKDTLQLKNAPELPKLIQSIEEIQKLCKNKGADLYVYLIPSKWDLYGKWIESKNLKLSKSYIYLNKYLAEYSKDKNYAYLDIKNSFTKEAKKYINNDTLLYWKDGTHLNYLGNKVLSDILISKFNDK